MVQGICSVYMRKMRLKYQQVHPEPSPLPLHICVFYLCACTCLLYHHRWDGSNAQPCHLTHIRRCCTYVCIHGYKELVKWRHVAFIILRQPTDDAIGHVPLSHLRSKGKASAYILYCTGSGILTRYMHI